MRLAAVDNTSNMATKPKGGKDKKGSKKEKVVEEPPPPVEEKKEEEPEENAEEKVPEEPPPQEEEPPKEPTPSPVYDEPTLTELIVEHYEGEKSKGMYDGEGVAYFSGGHDYKGQFSKGKMHGKGKYTWADGVSYEGDFSENRITGRGLYKWPDGSTYDGEVMNGLRHGHGTFRCIASPSSYTGQWNMGKRHSTGIMRYDTDGLSFYEGDWVNNLRHGYGVRRYRSGNVYEGEWAHNNRHGHGTMRWIDLDQSYSGQWENGVQHGHGEHTWYLKRVPGSQYPLRNRYVGDFFRGMRHGNGTFYYANGANYDGEWDSNLKQGRGKFTFKNGRIFEGMFIQDRMLEYPQFRMDGMNTPDISQIRTQTPDIVASAPDADNISVVSNESRNTLGPSLTLDIDHLLNEFSEDEREEELKQVMFVILRHITVLKKVYNFYAGLGHEASPDNTFIMTRLQFWRFLKDCQFHHQEATLAEMDRLLAVTGTPTDMIHSPLNKLLMREFLNHVITLSYHLFNEEHPGKGGILAWCLSTAIQNHIIPHACTVQGTFLYEPRKAVNALGYMDNCWEIFQCACRLRKYYPYEPSLKMRGFLFLLKDYRLINEILTPKHILKILAADNPTVYDGTDCNLELEMTFLEFFEALIGCAEVYVTEEMLKDPNTPRPSTVMSHVHTSFSTTTQASASRASGIIDDTNDDQNTTGGGSPQRMTMSPETGSPQLRAVSSADMTQKLSTDVSSTKHEPQGSAAVSTHTDLHPGSSHTHTQDTKAASKSEPSLDAKGAQSSHSLVTAQSSEHPPLLQSMLSMGGQTDMDADEEDLEEEVMDEDVRQFNFWTHQIHIFFIRKLFPAHENMEQVKQKRQEIRVEKLAAEIAAQKLREEQRRQQEAREAARIAEELAAKERATSQLSENTKDGDAETNTRTVSEAKT
ncbi:radial spoke head 10 homolog B-like [Ptychodera flava]|uniref:radial spoke head 10 homolog B-like n=1 Tax=Ptychodera flava TaxID=63121 RepID=UPI00396A0F1E